MINLTKNICGKHLENTVTVSYHQTVVCTSCNRVIKDQVQVKSTKNLSTVQTCWHIK